MKPFDIRELRDDGTTVQEELDTKWLEAELNQDDTAPEEVRLRPTKAGQLKFELSKVLGSDRKAPTVRLEGSVTAEVTTNCVRCLEEVCLPLTANLDLTLFPKAEPSLGRSKSTGEEAKEADEEMPAGAENEGTYAAGIIDIESIAREALLLGHFMNPVCPDETACEARTKTLLTRVNPGSDVLEETGPDPRWAALKNFDLKSD